MKPEYESDWCRMYRGDALAVLPTLPDASVDLIATDPPYFKVKGEWFGPLVEPGGDAIENCAEGRP